MFAKSLVVTATNAVKQSRVAIAPAASAAFGVNGKRYCHHEHQIKISIPKDLARNDSQQQRIPRPQDKAPHFKGQAVVNKQFKEISLENYRGKWLVFFFYPLDFTFVCPTEIVAFSDKADEFRKMNCEVVACSTDSHFSHLAWIATPRKSGGLGDMKIPVLSDYSKNIARSYGVLLDGLGAALRGLFLINPDGIVKHVMVNDLPVGRSVDEVLRLLQAFQYVEKHGEVCPANWTAKDPTIKPTAEGSKEYFQTVNKE